MHKVSLVVALIQMALLLYVFIEIFRLEKLKRKLRFKADKVIEFITEAEKCLDEAEKCLEEREKEVKRNEI